MDNLNAAKHIILYTFVLSLIAIYVHVKTSRIKMNDEMFTHVGMLEYHDGDKKVYLPVYKKN